MPYIPLDEKLPGITGMLTAQLAGILVNNGYLPSKDRYTGLSIS